MMTTTSLTATAYQHEPIMVSEVLAYLGSEARGEPYYIVDCTVGFGGHAEALLAAYPETYLLGIDRDSQALTATAARLKKYGKRVQLVKGRFSKLQQILAESRASGFLRSSRGAAGSSTLPQDRACVQGLLADFGVSSPQIDDPSRGFSSRFAGPLDMRMGQDSDEPALSYLERLTVAELTQVIWEFGEERYAKRIAKSILERRPLDTSGLKEAILKVLPARYDRPGAVARTFQALRILVNNELQEIADLLRLVPDILQDKAISVFISFHSLEDRLVKQFLKRQSLSCICAKEVPVCRCAQIATLQILTPKARVADKREVSKNPRARSAKLRAAKRLTRA